MGETIVITIPQSDYYVISLIIGAIFTIATIMSLDDCSKKTLVILGIIAAMCYAVSPIVGHEYDTPGNKANYEVAINRLQTIQAAYQEKPFFLKEEACEPGIWGEVEGYVGGFIFFGGNIYGRIDPGRVVTVVYEDNDSVIDHYVGVHRSISFRLDQAVIETILAEEHPYVMYPEARIDGDSEQLTLVPGNPHLYLPEGWKIL
jgi:hypothetical protein